ncbi:MAG: hypothetical protein R3Y64_09265 [Peptostreptococcaceae bacterium]
MKRIILKNKLKKYGYENDKSLNVSDLEDILSLCNEGVDKNTVSLIIKAKNEDMKNYKELLKFNNSQIKEILYGLYEKLDVSVYMDLKLSASKMAEIRINLSNGADSLNYLIDRNESEVNKVKESNPCVKSINQDFGVKSSYRIGSDTLEDIKDKIRNKTFRRSDYFDFEGNYFKIKSDF